MTKSLRRLTLYSVLLAVLLFPATVRAEELCTQIPSEPNIKIYRVFRPDSNEHLYTPDLYEVNKLVSGEGWVDEGVAWYAPRTGDNVYRLYNPATRFHIYTTDVTEKNTLAQRGWLADNGGKPYFYSGGNIPVYRLYNDALKTHLITKDQNEYNELAGRGWTQEGEKLRATGLTTAQSYQIGPYDISNVPSEYSIQADMKLAGTGTGNHAKLVAKTPTSAVSFGLQFDENGLQQYKDATSFIIENVHSNDKGGQEYTRTGYGALNKTFRVLLAVQSDGVCDVYINGNKIASVINQELVGKPITLTVEGSGRKKGDTVIASFKNIEVKKDGVYDPDKEWKTEIIDTNRGIRSDVGAYEKDKRIVISGVIRGVEGDWDSDYGTVSGTVNFV